MNLFDRRSVSAGLMGSALAGAAQARAGGGDSWRQDLERVRHGALFRRRAAHGFSLRLSRYPERYETWVWVHVLVDGELYAYTERQIPAASERVTADLPVGV